MQEFIQQLREQVQRIWGELNPQQKIIFVSAPVVLLLAMIFAVYFASRPQWVTLISSDDATQISQAVQHLESQGIDYQLSNQRTVQVQQESKARAALSLAGEGLLGYKAGPGMELFDQTRLGMTSDMFQVQHQRALQNELEEMVADGTPNVISAYVKLVIPERALFKSEQAVPSASVKIITRGSIAKQDVKGIQQLVAFSVEKLEPNRVAVVNERNQLLSEEGEPDSIVAQTSKQLDYKNQVEELIRRKLIQKLEVIAGPENYEVGVSVKLDWTESKQRQIDIQTDNQAAISEKIYGEESKTQGIAGPPGVSSNVQDEGIGTESEMTGTTIDETIVNYQYPWSEIQTQEETGEVTEVAVSVLLNYVENEDGEMVPREQADLTEIENNLQGVLDLQTIPLNFTLNQIRFDDSLERELARQRLWEMFIGGLKSIIPLLLLFALGYFAYTFFQKAFAAKEAEPEMVEEEVPIEPVTEARELSLSQLGLAEFGDVASLPAEEQRRLKMQEHVINYASEKPEEVAAIIKAWLSG